MPSTGIRFNPPRVQVPEVVDWLFLRAFSTPSASWGGDSRIDLSSLDGHIGATDLLPRVWSRIDRELLEAELDEGEVKAIEDAFHAAVALEIRDHETSRRLATVAAELQIPVIFLKGAALQLGGYAPSGARSAADVDVLVPTHDATRFHQALIQQDCRVLDLPASDQHLPTLEHSLGSMVEVHHRLRGLSVVGRSHATAEECLAQALCEEISRWPKGCFIPRAELLVAHLLVHTLSQHGFFPEVSRHIQLLADLQDLGFAGESGARYLDRIEPWIKTEVSSEELEAIRDLLQRLEKDARVSEIASGADGCAVMVRHFLAGAGDETYRQALKVEGWVQLVRGRARSLSAARTIYKALFLTRGQIDIIYGKPKSSLGYLGRRLWRPFDLVGRAMRSLTARVRLRRRVGESADQGRVEDVTSGTNR